MSIKHVCQENKKKNYKTRKRRSADKKEAPFGATIDMKVIDQQSFETRLSQEF